jgi:hypothetical protein
MSESETSLGTISRSGRILILLGAFLGWMFAGWEMSLLPLSARSVTIGMLQHDPAHTDWVTGREWFWKRKIQRRRPQMLLRPIN